MFWGIFLIPSSGLIKPEQFLFYKPEVEIVKDILRYSQINTKHINTVWAERTVVEC